ncbi:DUF4232 domain-containing protein [Streptomyces sp. NPDC059649]|uniref:DUF4232 domain-containing protein n=1 Tax=Streptomyces sp. NPDC059649 TaxID=3346895 RepID=UPI00368065A4
MSHHTMLRRGRKAAAASVIAVAALALTACQGNSPKADPAGSPSPASSAGSSAGTGGSSGSGSGSGSSGGQGSGTTSGGGSQTGKNGSGTSGSGGSASQTSSKAGSSARCTTGSLQAGWGSSGGGVPDMHNDAQQNVTVWLKNTGRSACRISGFPGVQIKANDGGSIDLPRSSKKSTPVTLRPGGTTAFTITFLPSVNSGDRKIKPGTVLVTPPNEKQHFQLKWPYGGALLDQSGATHPGTYVNPVNAA